MKENKLELKKALSMPIGVILLAAALAMKTFLSPAPIVDFLIGMFTGLSAVLNIYYLVAVVRKKEK